MNMNFYIFFRGTPNKHGFHLMQAMRFTVDEINNGTGPVSLLPGVKLGYQMYDVCSTPASILATLDLVAQPFQSPFAPVTEENTQPNNSLAAVAVIGPDSSTNTLTPASFLGAYLIPEVSLLERFNPWPHHEPLFTSSLLHCRSPMKHQVKS